MTEDFISTTKQIGNAIIDMSALLDGKLEKWSDATSRIDNLTEQECVGWVNKETADTGMVFVVDVQAPQAVRQAIIRLWAIESRDEGGTTLYNNLQLEFVPSYDQAALLTQKAGAATREDIKALLQDPNTRLAGFTVSKMSGQDATTQQSLGERYDLAGAELEGDAASKALIAAREVLLTLQASAAAEKSAQA